MKTKKISNLNHIPKEFRRTILLKKSRLKNKSNRVRVNAIMFLSKKYSKKIFNTKTPDLDLRKVKNVYINIPE